LGPLRVPMSKEGELSIPSAPGLLDRHDHKTWQDLGGSTLGERSRYDRCA